MTKNRAQGTEEAFARECVRGGVNVVLRKPGVLDKKAGGVSTFVSLRISTKHSFKIV